MTSSLDARQALKERFPKRPWLDVVSKGDLVDQVRTVLPPRGETSSASRPRRDPMRQVPESVRAQLPPGYLPVSVKTGQNVDALRGEIDRLLVDLAAILQQREKDEQAAAAAAAAVDNGANA